MTERGKLMTESSKWLNSSVFPNELVTWYERVKSRRESWEGRRGESVREASLSPERRKVSSRGLIAKLKALNLKSAL